jgi:azurin
VAGAFLLLVLGQPGCGPPTDRGGASRDTARASAVVEHTPDGARIVRINGNDQMRFDVTEIVVAPGERLQIVLTNVGRMPKQAMAHNWVLLRPLSAAELDRFAAAAVAHPPEYLPPDRSAVLAHTRMLGPGERDTLDLTAPLEPGEYVYVCTFPGHVTLMRGRLIVR